ncbi:MAG: phage tail tip fiber protein, partial [Plesiomonas shigelloides]
MSKATFRANADSKAVAENMQILTGQKGDKLDKALTYREAAAIGLLKLRRSGSGAIIPENPTPPERDPVWQGVEKPHAPVNVTADGAFHTVTLTWDIPTYKGHAFAEVWRAEFDDTVADKGNNLAKAVRVGTTLANVYADAVGKGFKAFYWVRFVNKNGYNGPYQSALGLLAETSADVDEIIASATNFAIYNPAKPTEKEIIFGVTDDGKVGIREAVIKKATIQIIHSEKITADYIKAGVSISAPLISGGSFDMSNAYMSGGAAGFGLGGPYSGWGKGWNSIIYSDGSIYTNRLNAEGGNIRDMRMERCVIAESCDVRGTLYAEKIVGDIVRTYAMGIGSVVT